MYSTLKNWCIGVTTALSISACGAAATLFVDVQILKHEQAFQKEMLVQQQQTSNQIKDLLTSLDKQMAVQEKTVTTLSEMVDELKTVRGKF